MSAAQQSRNEQLLLSKEAEIQALKRQLAAKQDEVHELGRLILDLKRQANFKFQQMQQSMEWMQRDLEFKVKRSETLQQLRQTSHGNRDLDESV